MQKRASQLHVSIDPKREAGIHNNCDKVDDVNEILYEYVKTFALQSI